MNALGAAARFVVVSGLAFGSSFNWPALVLGAPAWLAWSLLTMTRAADLAAPVLTGATITFGRASAPLTLEDPYVLAGIPLYLGLWAIAARPLRAVPWRRLVAGLLALEVFAGIVLALVAVCVDRGLTTSSPREPIELVALTAVAAIRVLPLALWLVLDPARATLLALPLRAARGKARGRGERGGR